MARDIIAKTQAYAEAMQAARDQRAARKARVNFQRQANKVSAALARAEYDAADVEYMAARGIILARIMQK